MTHSKIKKISSLVSQASHSSSTGTQYIDGAPHIKHPSLRNLYSETIVRIYDDLLKECDLPTVLDLGAGEGSVTLPLLSLGARVVAVDISEHQLSSLKTKCRHFKERLEIRCCDVFDAINKSIINGDSFDLIVANSFLHHVSDYLNLLEQSAKILSPIGRIFSFQDPDRYDRLGIFTHSFSTLAFLWWRIFKGDLVGGLGRRIRRSLGIYKESSPEDDAEYHVVRNGVDSVAIQQKLISLGFDCNVVRYFSTQSAIWQPIGEYLHLRNTFMTISTRRSRPIITNDHP